MGWGEMGEDNERKRGKGFQKHVQRTHGPSQSRVRSKVGSENGWGGGSGGEKMETTVLEQQFLKK